MLAAPAPGWWAVAVGTVVAVVVTVVVTMVVAMVVAVVVAVVVTVVIAVIVAVIVAVVGGAVVGILILLVSTLITRDDDVHRERRGANDLVGRVPRRLLRSGVRIRGPVLGAARAGGSGGGRRGRGVVLRRRRRSVPRGRVLGAGGVGIGEGRRGRGKSVLVAGGVLGSCGGRRVVRLRAGGALGSGRRRRRIVWLRAGGVVLRGGRVRRRRGIVRLRAGAGVMVVPRAMMVMVRARSSLVLGRGIGRVLRRGASPGRVLGRGAGPGRVLVRAGGGVVPRSARLGRGRRGRLSVGGASGSRVSPAGAGARSDRVGVSVGVRVRVRVRVGVRVRVRAGGGVAVGVGVAVAVRGGRALVAVVVLVALPGLGAGVEEAAGSETGAVVPLDVVPDALVRVGGLAVRLPALGDVLGEVALEEAVDMGVAVEKLGDILCRARSVGYTPVYMIPGGRGKTHVVGFGKLLDPVVGQAADGLGLGELVGAALEGLEERGGLEGVVEVALGHLELRVGAPDVGGLERLGEVLEQLGPGKDATKDELSKTDIKVSNPFLCTSEGVWKGGGKEICEQDLRSADRPASRCRQRRGQHRGAGSSR